LSFEQKLARRRLELAKPKGKEKGRRESKKGKRRKGEGSGGQEDKARGGRPGG
jgi:hypothetical protein